MLKNVIYLPNGTRIGSGAGQANAIQECTITECVNSGEELELGSTCCSCLEAKIFAPSGGLSVGAGTEVTLCKADDTGNETQVGVFTMEKPTQASPNIYKVTAYDWVAKLDKDLSAWLKGLTGWPYTLITFAGMVCKACGLTLATKSIPNGNFPVQQFNKPGVTGRQLMRWIGEIACRFCRANAKGEIEFSWYTDSGVTIQPTGDRYYFAGALTYEDYTVAPIDAVKLRLADSESGALWPTGAADNPYIITGNPILLAEVGNRTQTALQNIQKEIAGVSYTPCKVSLPASMDIRAGNTVKITDKNGKTITAYVMTKTQTGQRDTLECTGSARRDSSTVVNNKSPAQAAQQAVDAQTQKEIFNKLTNGGQAQGLFLGDDGTVYLNVTFAVTGVLDAKKVTIENLTADLIKSGTLDAKNVTIENLTADLIKSGTLDAKNVTIVNLSADIIKSGTLDAARIDVKNLVAQQLEAESSGYRLAIKNGAVRMHAGDKEVMAIFYDQNPMAVLVGTNRYLEYEPGGVMVGSSAVDIRARMFMDGSRGVVEADDIRFGSNTPRFLGKNVDWKPNGDGTYTLIGT